MYVSLFAELLEFMACKLLLIIHYQGVGDSKSNDYVLPSKFFDGLGGDEGYGFDFDPLGVKIYGYY